MRQITTSTLSNQTLATALLCHTYTVDADRLLFVRLFADQVAGNGTYYAYITIQRLGAGSAYEIQPRASAFVALSVTAVGFTTIPLPVKNTDVVKVYLLGLAGDTTTPDIVTEIWEDDAGTTLATIAGYLDTEIAAILAAVDTEVAAIKAKTDLIPAAPAAVGDVPTANANADALLDRAAGVETGLTPRQALRLFAAALAGKLSGAATTTVTIRNAVADSKDRIVATVDSDGNRSAVTTDTT